MTIQIYVKEEIDRLIAENKKLRNSLQEMINMISQRYTYRKNSADRAQVVLELEPLPVEDKSGG